jgi:hypothetical protein
MVGYSNRMRKSQFTHVFCEVRVVVANSFRCYLENHYREQSHGEINEAAQSHGRRVARYARFIVPSVISVAVKSLRPQI